MQPLHILSLILVAAIWGFNFVVIRLGLDAFPPLLFSGMRFLLAAIPLVFFIRRPQVPWRLIVATGIVLGVIKFSFLFIGMDVGLSPGLASLILQSQAFFTVLLGMVVFGDRPRRLQIVGMVVAFFGIALIGSTVDQSFSALGLALGIAAAMTWACSNMLMKKTGQVDMLSLMVWISLIPPIPLFLISAGTDGWARDLAALQAIDLTAVGAVLYVAYAATIFGFGVWGAMIRRYGTSTVAPFSLLVPIFGMTSSALVFGEDFGPLRMAAAGLIVLGLVLNVVNPAWMRRTVPAA